MIKAVIFDFDGVIADTVEASFFSFREAFRRYGVDFRKKSFIELRSKGIGLYNIIKSSPMSPANRLTEQQIKEIADIKTKIQLGKISETPLFQGVKELLEALHGNYGIALGTANTSELAKPYLEEKGIAGHFDAIISTKDVARSKPAPDIFLRAAEELKVKPEECVVFEDSLGGVQAAKSAGMKVIAVATGETPAGELKELNPDLVVKNLAEREKIMRFLNQKALKRI